MSFRLQPAPVARPNRCQLFGPGSRPALFPKMASSAADVINLDLEDSVAPSDKDSARTNVIDALANVDWGQKTLSVRINGLDTPYWYRDVVDLLEQAGPRLDQIMIPKVGNGADIYAVDALVSAIETARGREKPIAFEVIIESAVGISNVKEIAAASPRLHTMSLGAADLQPRWGWRQLALGAHKKIITCSMRINAIGQTLGIGPNPQSLRPAACMGSCPSTGRLEIFPMMPVSLRKPNALPL